MKNPRGPATSIREKKNFARVSLGSSPLRVVVVWRMGTREDALLRASLTQCTNMVIQTESFTPPSPSRSSEVHWFLLRPDCVSQTGSTREEGKSLLGSGAATA